MTTTAAKTDTNSQNPQPAIHVIRDMLDPRIVTRAAVVIIGLGGIGLYLSKAVVTFLSGLLQSLGAEETIDVLLCDGDSFTLENTYRMDVPAFGNKAAVVAEEMLEHTDCPGLAIRWRPDYVDEENVANLIQEGDCVLLACDNHKTRNIVGRYCSGGALENVVLISGGNDGVEEGLRGTYGNVQVYVREKGKDLTAALEKFHPEIAAPTDHSPSEQSCIEQAAGGAPQFSIVNLAVASGMSSALLRLLMPVEGERMYDEVALDVLDAINRPHWLSGPQELSPKT